MCIVIAISNINNIGFFQLIFGFMKISDILYSVSGSNIAKLKQHILETVLGLWSLRQKTSIFKVASYIRKPRVLKVATRMTNFIDK